MLHERDQQDYPELRDPQLSALLRKTFADDPALLAAPGRTERIMRRVLASGVRPTPRKWSWAPFAWATGSLATTAVAALLIMTLARVPMRYGDQTISPSKMTLAVVATGPSTSGETPSAPEIANGVAPPLPAPPPVVERPTVCWQRPAAHPRIRYTAPTDAVTVASLASTPTSPEAIAQTSPASPTQETTPAATTENQTQVASALYDAGTAADTAGDYADAYQAYQASYEMLPMPDALLSSGKALEHLGDQALNADAS
jgi:hypothetical protein